MPSMLPLLYSTETFDFSGRGFDVETMAIIRQAFDKVREEIHDEGQPAASVNKMIAERLIEIAARGERAPDEMCEAADRVVDEDVGRDEHVAGCGEVGAREDGATGSPLQRRQSAQAKTQERQEARPARRQVVEALSGDDPGGRQQGELEARSEAPQSAPPFSP